MWRCMLPLVAFALRNMSDAVERDATANSRHESPRVPIPKGPYRFQATATEGVPRFPFVLSHGNYHEVGPLL